MISEAERWNHNIHYFDVLLAAVPEGARSALDVGTGDGMLARRLRGRVPQVTGIDRDAEQIALARRETPKPAGIEYIHGDVMTQAFSEPFDAVLSVATLHHLALEPALRRLADLVSPGGVLAIEGLARTTTPPDFGWDCCGAVFTRILKRRGGHRYYEHSAPIVWPPPNSYTEVRDTAAQVLPGVRYRRHALWRYTLVWTKP